MPAGRYDISIDQGSDFAITITFKDSTRTAVNLTGYTFLAQVRQSYGSILIVTFTTAIVSSVDGKVQISLTKALSSTLLCKQYVYDLIGTVGGVTTRFMQGFVNVSPMVTQ